MGDVDRSLSAAAADALRALLDRPICSRLRGFRGPRPIHLVGGALRDAVLATPHRDLDVVVSGWGRDLADRLAESLGGRMIALGGDRFAAYRITAPRIQIDIWDRGSKTIEADLERRDLTIHSLAIDLDTAEIIDPFRGLADIVGRRLRMTTRRSFDNDPLRVMRLCRFAAQLADFTTDPDTLDLARAAVDQLESVPSERVRTELSLTLGCEHAANATDLWVDLDIVPGALFALTATATQRNVLRERLRASSRRLAAATDRLPNAIDRPVAHLGILLANLDRLRLIPISDGWRHLLATGLITKALGRRLKRLVEADGPPTGKPAQRWWLHELGDLWTSALAVSAALEVEASEARSDKRLDIVVDLAGTEAEQIFDPPWLLVGDDLKDHLGLEPGRALGRVLRRVRRLQIETGLRDREQALSVAANLAAKIRPS